MQGNLDRKMSFIKSREGFATRQGKNLENYDWNLLVLLGLILLARRNYLSIYTKEGVVPEKVVTSV
jgi:hypothetical protein